MPYRRQIYIIWANMRFCWDIPYTHIPSDWIAIYIYICVNRKNERVDAFGKPIPMVDVARFEAKRTSSNNVEDSYHIEHTFAHDWWSYEMGLRVVYVLCDLVYLCSEMCNVQYSVALFAKPSQVKAGDRSICSRSR